MATRPGVRGLPFRIVAAIAVMLLALPLALSGCALAEQMKGDTAGTSSANQGAYTAPGVVRDKGVAADAALTGGAVAESAVPPPQGGSGADAAKVPDADKLIIRNKTLRVEVKDVEGTISKVRELAKRDGADITQMQVATSLDQPIYRPVDESTGAGYTSTALRAYVTIRVPADKYQAFIDDAAKLGTVKYQTESAEDVTQQHIDLSARLQNLRAQEAQLRDFFTKAKNVSELIQIEQELSRVRGEIESMSAQVAYLERQAAMATVTLELTEPQAVVRPAGIDWGTKTAFTNSVRAFVDTFNVLVVLLGPLLALGLFVALPAYLIVRFLWKRHVRRQATAAAKVPAADAETPGTGDASA